ncbi:MAG: ABC transporter permease subunit [Gammaproteobacteria bacterium]|nr:ABC transporter permease subunit [Gammaproteobacteria bacterium]
MANRNNAGIGRLIYDQKFRSIFFQVLVAVALIAFVAWIADNTLSNIDAQEKKKGFGFLEDTAGFQILNTLGTAITDYTPGVSTYWDVFVTGVANTLVVAFLGVIAATAIGFVMGIFRLSNNAILKGFSTVYVEVLRNVPLLLQLFFWYFFVLRAMPDARSRIQLWGEEVGINITGLYAPAPQPQEGFGWVWLALAVAVVGGILFSNYAKKLQAETGKQLPVLWTQVGLIIGLPLITYWVMGSPLEWEYPTFNETGPIFKRGFGDTGLVLIPEMIAVWLALSLYTASFIAEIVRAGIMAVPKGQSEASSALGLKPNVALRMVIIPQAMRVIVPPLTSQYLNLTKNSSLSVAIAYPDVVSVFAGTALNQVGQEIEMVFMMMMVYLTVSLSTSIFMNWFNGRIKLVER